MSLFTKGWNQGNISMEPKYINKPEKEVLDMDLIQWRPGRELGPWRRLRDIEDEMDTLLGRVFGRESPSRAAPTVFFDGEIP